MLLVDEKPQKLTPFLWLLDENINHENINL